MQTKLNPSTYSELNEPKMEETEVWINRFSPKSTSPSANTSNNQEPFKKSKIQCKSWTLRSNAWMIVLVDAKSWSPNSFTYKTFLENACSPNS